MSPDLAAAMQRLCVIEPDTSDCYLQEGGQAFRWLPRPELFAFMNAVKGCRRIVRSTSYIGFSRGILRVANHASLLFALGSLARCFFSLFCFSLILVAYSVFLTSVSSSSFCQRRHSHSSVEGFSVCFVCKCLRLLLRYGVRLAVR